MSLSRRDWLRLAAASAIARIAAGADRALAFGDAGRLAFAQLQHGGEDDPRPHALRRLAFEAMDRTSLEVAPLVRHLPPESPELFEYPLLVLAGLGPFPPFSEAGSRTLRRHLTYGGLLFIDSADGGAGFDEAVRREVSRALPESTLAHIPQGHVFYKSFYLIDHQAGRQIVAPYLEGVTLGAGPRPLVDPPPAAAAAESGGSSQRASGRLAVIYSQNDLAGAWSRDDRGDWEYPVVPGGEEQRELAFRLGVNLLMYATCLDYKDDQVHLPFILKRRR